MIQEIRAFNELFSSILRSALASQDANREMLRRLQFASSETVAYEYFYEWVAETTACDDCMALDGVRVATSDGFPFALHPDDNPPHPNCRCTVTIGRGRLTNITRAIRKDFKTAFDIMNKKRGKK